MPVLDGIAAAEQIAAQRIAPVVILTAFSQRDLVERARDAGAMAYLVKPFTQAHLVPAIEVAVSRFAELATLEAEVADLTERLETRKAVERAKSLLMEQLDLSEPEAFRWIQKTAMDLRLSMRQVAEGVVEHGPGHRRVLIRPADMSRLPPPVSPDAPPAEGWRNRRVPPLDCRAASSRVPGEEDL